VEALVPSIYELKPGFQELLRPVTRALWRSGVSPNQVTLAAFLLSAATGACLALFPTERWPLFLLALVLFVRMALNAIDGMLAREHGMKSALGAILNEMGDVASDSALYLPLASVRGFSPPLIVVAVLLAVFTEMIGVVGTQLGAPRSYKGPMGKSDRAFVFGAMALLIGLGVPVGRWMTVVLALMVLLLGVTIFNRGREALRGA
jgi:CDP-diacylglycerol--glycerol-3-phosphate 3-phosphatidyltransferase